MRPITLLFVVVFMGLPLLWYVPAMIWGYQVTTESMSEDGAISEELVGGPAPVQWFRNRAELRGYYSLEDLTNRRTVSFDIDLDFNDLLAPGESVPDNDLLELYVKARAPSQLIAFCPEILGSFAKKCDVGSSGGRLSRDGRVRIQGSLTYLPAYELGNVAEVQNGQVMVARARLLDTNAEQIATPENRQAALSRALELCKLVRAELGNCLISDLSFKQTRSRRAAQDEQPQLSATVRVAVFADKTVYRQDSLQNEIERIQEVLVN
ncbi:MAG: hypothetical protein AAGF50_01450 [Pseudomonadota bacterium]